MARQWYAAGSQWTENTSNSLFADGAQLKANQGGSSVQSSSVSLQSTTTISPRGRIVARTSSHLTANATLSTGGHLSSSSPVVLNSSSTVAVKGRIIAGGLSLPSSNSTIITNGHLVAKGQVSLNSQASLISKFDKIISSITINSSLNLFLNAVPPGVSNNNLPLSLTASPAGVNAENASLPLYVNGTNQVVVPLNLFLKGTNVGILQTHLNLYTGGSPLTKSLPLFVQNSYSSTVGKLDLFVAGSGYRGNNFASLNMFIQRWPANTLSLFVKAPNESNNMNIPLYTAGAGIGSGNLTLNLPKTYGVDAKNILLWIAGF